MKEKLLLVEDDDLYAKSVQAYLEEFDIIWAQSFNEAKEILSKKQIKLILLDLNLNEKSGLSFLGELQKLKITIPVIMLTGSDDLANKIASFSIGAEDYILKHTDPEELRARIKIRLKLTSKSHEVHAQNIHIDLQSQTVSLTIDGKNKKIDLTPKEYRFLVLLVQNPDRVMSRNSILDAISGTDTTVLDRTVDSIASRLRKKLNGSQCVLEAVYGEGYVLRTSTD